MPTGDDTGRRVRGRTAEQRRLDRREALLAAGLELFGTKGYAATSVEEVCRTAFVTTRNFYAEFANREALLVAVGERIAADVYLASTRAADPIPEPSPGASAPPATLRDLVRGYVATLVRAVTDDPRVARIAFVEYVGVNPDHEATRRRARRAYADNLAALLEPLLDERGVPAGHRAAVVLGLVGGVDELIADWVTGPDDRPSIDELIDAITSFALAVLVTS